MSEKKFESGHTYEEVKGEEGTRLTRDYFVYTDGAVRLTPGNWIFPKTYVKFADLIYNFKARPSDVFVATFPKSGTTWMQEIIWNLTHNPDLTNPASIVSLDARVPNFEADMMLTLTGAPPPNPEGDPMKIFAQLFPGMHWSEGVLIRLGAFAPDPRLNKIHLPLSLVSPELIKTGKVIYVTRDPRDVLISFYHYAKLQILYGFRGNLEKFVDDFVNDRIFYGPYFQHVKEAWDRRNDPKFLFVYYEDLVEDAVAEIKKIDKFMGTNRTDKQIENVAKCTSFSAMRENSKTNPPTSNDNIFFDKKAAEKEGGFFRKGKVGTWKEELSPELQKKVNDWLKRNLPQFGEDFKYKPEE